MNTIRQQNGTPVEYMITFNTQELLALRAALMTLGLEQERLEQNDPEFKSFIGIDRDLLESLMKKLH